MAKYRQAPLTRPGRVQAGLPDGVFNVVQGDKEAVNALIGVTCGKEGVKFYTRRKSIMQRWSDSIDAGAEFVMPTTK